MSATSSWERLRHEDPDDLAAWRAYGDELRERGDPRGRLVELELRLAHTVRDDERAALRGEVDELTRQHQESWDAELPDGVRAVRRRYGFATKVSVTLSEGAAARVAEALRDGLVTALRIRPDVADDGDEEDDEVWEGPDLDEDGMPVPTLREASALADLDLGGITELDLSYFRIGDEGAKHLAAAASAGRIRALDLRYCALGDDGVTTLVGSGRFDDIRRLHLQHNRLTATGVRALAGLRHLTELDLRYNRIGAAGAQAVIDAPFVGSLTRLLLHRADVSDAGAEKLANAASLPTALRSLWRCQ